MENLTTFNDQDRIDLHAASQRVASPAVGRERAIEAEAKMLAEQKKRTEEFLRTEQGRIGELGRLLKTYRQEEAIDALVTKKDEFQGEYELSA